MAAPRNRTYRPPKKGHIDLGAILLGALGGTGVGAVEPVPQEDLSVPGFNYDDRPLEPTRFQVQSKSKDYTGKGQELANRLTGESILAEEAAKRELRTKEAGIPLRVKELEAETPVLANRSKTLADIANDAELAKRLKIDPVDLKKLQDEENIKTKAEVARLEATGPIKAKQEVDKTRKTRSIDLLVAEGIVPTEENIAALDNVLTERRLAEKASGSEAGALTSELSGATSRRGLEIEENTRPTDVRAAIERSKFGLGEVEGARGLQPMAIQAKRKQIPLETEGMELDNLRKRLFPTQEGTEYYDPTISRKRPAFGHTATPMDQVIGTDLKTKYPGIDLPFNIPAGNPANYPGLYPTNSAPSGVLAPDEEIVEINGQRMKRKKRL